MSTKIVEPSAAVVLKSIVVDLDQEESGVRLIKIKEGGMGEGKTTKIHNFHLDLISMTELIASSIITVTDPLMVVAGILHIIYISISISAYWFCDLHAYPYIRMHLHYSIHNTYIMHTICHV